MHSVYYGLAWRLMTHPTIITDCAFHDTLIFTVLTYSIVQIWPCALMDHESWYLGSCPIMRNIKILAYLAKIGDLVRLQIPQKLTIRLSKTQYVNVYCCHFSLRYYIYILLIVFLPLLFDPNWEPKDVFWKRKNVSFFCFSYCPLIFMNYLFMFLLLFIMYD